MDEALVNACKKLVLLGNQAGFSADDMLTLLLNGMTVDQLLAIIQNRIAAIVSEPTKSRCDLRC
jgi:hypothetical protein